MSTRYEVLNGGAVINTIMATAKYMQDNFSQDAYRLAADAAPVVIAPPKLWTAFDFYRRFTSAERIAIRELAKTDMHADDFLRTLDATIAAGANVRADDPDTIAGINYLQTAPADNPVLTATRAAEIML